MSSCLQSQLVVGAALVLTLSLRATAGDFVSSLHNSYVVNLDFENDLEDAAFDDSETVKGAEERNTKIMAFAGGKRKFKCTLPIGKDRNTSGSSNGDISESRSHFMYAKLAPMKGVCWKTRKDYWSYDVCFGRKVVQYRPDTDARFSLGERLANRELLPNGSITELYTGGTDNRTTQIRYVCGPSEMSTRTLAIEENMPLFYTITVTGPAFCKWQKDGSEAEDAEGRVLPVSALLEELRGTCINTTQGWWTYEYCYPTSLVQYHIASGGKRDPEHVLGTLNGTSASIEPNKVLMNMVRLKPSISPRERRAAPSNHRTLRQKLGGGTRCDETSRERQSVMHFQCASNWQSQPETRIVSISEGSLCEYEMLIYTTLLCGHPKLLPTLPRGKETIQCVAEPEEL